MLDQLLAVDEEGSAGLVAAEAVQQLDGLPAFEAEEFFDHGAVEDRDRESAEFLDDTGKMKQPKGLWGQGGFPYLLYVTTQLCGMGVFRGVKYPMIIHIMVGYWDSPMSPHPQIPLCCLCGSFQLFCRGWCLACYRRRARSKARFGGLREKILARDHHRCRVCGVREGLVVHHRLPRNVYAALITLCAACHARLHRLGAIHRWVPENLLELWAEQHPGVARQIQFSEIVRP